MLNKRSSWIFYTLQMVFLVLFSINAHLWGDVAIDSIYCLIGIGGFFLWKKGNKADAISTYGAKGRILWSVATVLAIASCWAILERTNNPLPLLDSITSITSIVATWFMFRHKLETWVVWFINDIFYIAEYFFLPNRALYLIGLYVIWTILALLSFVNWRRLHKRGCFKNRKASTASFQPKGQSSPSEDIALICENCQKTGCSL